MLYVNYISILKIKKEEIGGKMGLMADGIWGD